MRFFFGDNFREPVPGGYVVVLEFEYLCFGFHDPFEVHLLCVSAFGTFFDEVEGGDGGGDDVLFLVFRAVAVGFYGQGLFGERGLGLLGEFLFGDGRDVFDGGEASGGFGELRGESGGDPLFFLSLVLSLVLFVVVVEEAMLLDFQGLIFPFRFLYSIFYYILGGASPPEQLLLDNRLEALFPRPLPSPFLIPAQLNRRVNTHIIPPPFLPIPIPIPLSSPHRLDRLLLSPLHRLQLLETIVPYELDSVLHHESLFL